MSESRRNLLCYLALLLLLGLSLVIARAEIGPLRVALHLLVAAAQVCLVFVVFMRLSAAAALVRVFATGAALWLLIMFGFSFLDYASRDLGMPPAPPPHYASRRRRATMAADDGGADAPQTHRLVQHPVPRLRRRHPAAERQAGPRRARRRRRVP